MNGELGRVDGCVGFALKHPKLSLTCTVDEETSFVGVGSEYLSRAHEVVEKARSLFHVPPVRIELLETFGTHHGLGFGTQLLLSCAKAVATLAGEHLATREAASFSRRGGTSGIGVATHEYGGFVIDGGHSFGRDAEKSCFGPSRDSNAPPAPVAVRLEFPDWSIVCATIGTSRVSGSVESQFFRDACPVPATEVGDVCRIVLMLILPGISSRDIAALNKGIALLQDVGFKRRVWGVQDRAVRDLADCFVGAGLSKPGLSSMGPTLFSFVADESAAEQAVQHIRSSMAHATVWHTRVQNSGANYTATPSGLVLR